MWMRWRVIHLYYDFGWTGTEVHGHMISGGDDDFSQATAYEIIAIFNGTGDVTTPASGQRTKLFSIPDDTWEYIIDSIEGSPSLYLDELIDLAHAAHGGARIPLSTLCWNLRRANYTVRVLKQLAIQRCVEDEESWAEMVSGLTASYCMFMDFSHQNPRKMVRRHGRGKTGARTYAEVDFGYGKRYSVQALISLTGKGVTGLEGGILDYATTEGNADADMTIAMVYQKVLPHCRPYPGPNSIVICDNAGYYKDLRLRAMIEATGARFMHLDPYAKHENPIEESLSKKNAFLLRHRALAIADPPTAVSMALDSITGDDAAGYYRHAGFNVKTTMIMPSILGLPGICVYE
jgi:hypothetical protein